MRLIDADAIKIKPPKNSSVEFDAGALYAIDKICEMPTIDPVKHGKWVTDKGIYKCTECNGLCTVAGWANCIPEEQMYRVFKFCPNCGARMDGE